MTRKVIARLILASGIAPAVPIVIISLLSFGKAWFPLLLVMGYLSFLVFGAPLIGILISRRNLGASLAAGAAAAWLPVFLLDAFSMFTTGPLFSLERLLGYGMALLAGALGGAVFWLIAFAGQRRDRRDA